MGIDAGSRAIKVVIYDGDRNKVLGQGIANQGVKQQELVQELFERVLRECGVERKDLAAIVATGYGRHRVELEGSTTITEISCHARGVRHLSPQVKTVVEIGGQDSKLIRLNEQGGVRDFSMNDRCAAGTGRFLEIVVERLEIDFAEMGRIVAESNRPATISSMCAVFAETEIIGLLADGVSAADIAAGVQLSIATRVAAMAGRKVEPPVVLSGGVALVPGMATALEQTLGQTIEISPQPQYTGALGAAILASSR
jgi:predicted CoA-substrate-specific enzyme activase